MNTHERKMCGILKRGKDSYGVVATKAEFEAEGTRTDELLSLLVIAHRVDVDIALKVSGCEAMRNMLEAKQFVVRYIISPMAKAPHALGKYIQAIGNVFALEEREKISFICKIETITAYENIEAMAALASSTSECNDVFFGRAC